MYTVKRIHFETIHSTNSWAKENSFSFDINDLTVVTADEQTKGRGRYGNSWHSPKKKNIYASFCLFFDAIHAKTVGDLVTLAGCDLLCRYGLKAFFKWPNDLFVNGKKIAGILTETQQHKNRLFVIAGIGMNINALAVDLEKVGQPATSLAIETNEQYDVAALTTALIDEYLSRVTRL